MYRSGDVVLAYVHYTDTMQVKKRPALVLYSENNNIVVAGITSNTNMEGIIICKDDGAIKDSIIKTNYIFTISSNHIIKKLFVLNQAKKQAVYNRIINSMSGLQS